MVRNIFRWVGCHRKTSLGLFLLFTFVLLNVMAYLHARAMTCYAPARKGTDKPESLSALGKVKILFTGVTVPRPSGTGVTPQDRGLPFEVHRLTGAGSVELEAWHIPCRQARGLILMFHGYAACKESLLPEAQVLHEEGYALLLVDFRGSGGSSGNETTIGVLEAEDVTLAVEHAKTTWEDQPLILYGQSMGSVAILRAVAVRGVRPQAVVLQCPFDRLVHTVANRFDAMGIPAFPCVQLLVFWGGLQHGFNGFDHNPVEYAGHVECPVLLMHGAHDPRVTKSDAEAIFQGLRGPKEFELFAEAGHESYLSRQPERWREVVVGFLTRYGEQAASTR